MFAKSHCYNVARLSWLRWDSNPCLSARTSGLIGCAKILQTLTFSNWPQFCFRLKSVKPFDSSDHHLPPFHLGTALIKFFWPVPGLANTILTTWRSLFRRVHFSQKASTLLPASQNQAVPEHLSWCTSDWQLHVTRLMVAWIISFLFETVFSSWVHSTCQSFLATDQSLLVLATLKP